jgi:excisionase family DNA binding protein
MCGKILIAIITDRLERRSQYAGKRKDEVSKNAHPVSKNPMAKDEKKLLSLSEACFSLGISRSTMYRLIADGLIIPLKIGRSTRITPASLDRFVSRLETCAREKTQ